MIDLKQLEIDRKKATEDKADLFDFYHKNWDKVIKELQRVYDSVNRMIENVERMI